MFAQQRRLNWVGRGCSHSPDAAKHSFRSAWCAGRRRVEHDTLSESSKTQFCAFWYLDMEVSTVARRSSAAVETHSAGMWILRLLLCLRRSVTPTGDKHMWLLRARTQ